MNQSRRKHLTGFTLIELLVVIAIIALLVSILLPSLQRAKELAQSTACGSHLRALMVGQAYYAEDVGHYAGYYWSGGPPICFLFPYLEGNHVWNGYTAPGQPINAPPNVCPNEPPAIKAVGGVSLPYGWNNHLGGHTYTWPTVPAAPTFPFRRIGQIDNPSGLIGWADGGHQGGKIYPSYMWGWQGSIILRHGGEGSINAQHFYQSGQSPPASAYANAVFLDAHVQQLTYADTYSAPLFVPAP